MAEKHKAKAQVETALVKVKDPEYDPLDIIKKSNKIVGSKYKMSLLANRMFNVGLARAKMEYDIDADCYRPVARFNVTEILDEKRKVGSGYRQARDACNDVQGKKFMKEDDEANNRFHYITIVNSCKYDNGQVEMKFEPSISKYVTDLQGDYTVFSLTTLMQFDNVYAHRLYEILRSVCYHSKFAKKKTGVHKYVTTLSRLKLDIGVVDSDDIRSDMDKKRQDIDAAVSKVEQSSGGKSTKYPKWSDFNRYVLTKAVKSINAVSDIRVEYIPHKHGKESRVTEVEFIIELIGQVPGSRQKNASEDEIIKMMKDMDEFLYDAFTIKEKRELLLHANYDLEYFKEKYELMRRTPNVQNVIGWLISALDEDYNDFIESPFTEVESVFERLWKLYPKRRNKMRVSAAQKQKIEDIGFEKMKLAIDRYVKEVETQRENGFTKLQYKGGDTFFNGAFEDYLTDDFEDIDFVNDRKRNTFHNFESRENIDYDEIAKSKIKVNREMR